MLKRSIITKYIFLGLIILTLITSFTVLSFWFTNRIGGDATRINYAGRMRMLSFEMGWLLNKIVREEVEYRTDTLNHINIDLALLEGTIRLLGDKEKIYGLGPLPNNELVIQHKKISDGWSLNVKPLFMSALEGN